MRSQLLLTEGKLCWLGRKTPTRFGNVELILLSFLQDPLGNGRDQSIDGIGEGDLGVEHCRRLLLTALPKPENDREPIKAATTQ